MELTPTSRERIAEDTGNRGSSWYDFDVDMTSESTHAKVIRLVGSDKRVLELGCATGYISRVLQQRGCQVVGVEISRDMAKRAAAYCEEVVVGDIGRMDLTGRLGKGNFDVVLAADILEHLADPLPALRMVKECLRPDGYLIASIPNVAHGSVRLALLGGRFPYADKGLLDRSHVRFFTWQSIQEMFEATGFAIGHVERQILQLDASEVRYERDSVSEQVLATLSQDPEALTYQFIVVAYPLPRADLNFIQEQMIRVAEERARTQEELERLQRTLSEQTQHLDEAVGRADHANKQIELLRVRLLDLHQQLVERDDDLIRLRQAVAERDAWLCDRDKHVADLQVALDRILYSRPGRILRGLRSLVTLGWR